MQRRFTALAHAPIQVRADGDKRIITGYGAVFYDGSPGSEYRIWDDMVERIMPGAFDRAIREDDVRGLFNHNPDHLLGRNKAGTMTLSVDAKGLRYEITPPPQDKAPIVGQVLASIERGDLTGSSFAFIPRKTVWVEQPDPKDSKRKMFIRELHEVELFDVCPVTYPAYEATTTGLRSADVDGDGGAVRKEFHEWQRMRSLAHALLQVRARAIEVTEKTAVPA